MSNCAPIALFTYNRPDHTRQTLDALADNYLASDSILYVFSDGPKQNASPQDKLDIQKIRNIITQEKRFYDVQLICSEQNKGLAKSIVDGVTKTVNEHGNVIVLEDDLLTSPWFLTYMNEGLSVYKNNQNVYSINGYMFDLGFSKNKPTFLCPWATTSWGWATWKDRWSCYSEVKDYKTLFQEHSYLKKRFNLADYDYVSMLNNQNSWAINWLYSVYLRNGIGLYPFNSLVQNIGFDGSGEHWNSKSMASNLVKSNRLQLEKIEILKQDKIDFQLYSEILDHFTEKKAPILRSKKEKIIELIKIIIKG